VKSYLITAFLCYVIDLLLGTLLYLFTFVFLFLYILMLFCVLISLVLVFLSVNKILGFMNSSQSPSSNYECGFYPLLTSNFRFKVNYWMILFLFLIWDLELILGIFYIFSVNSLSSYIVQLLIFDLFFFDLYFLSTSLFFTFH